MHVYCRLRDLGMRKKEALCWAKKYEKAIKYVKKNWTLMGAIMFAFSVILWEYNR